MQVDRQQTTEAACRRKGTRAQGPKATPPALLVTLVIEQMRYAASRSAPGAARCGSALAEAKASTHMCMHLQRRETGACARNTTLQKRLGISGVGDDELAVQAFPGPLFRKCPPF